MEKIKIYSSPTCPYCRQAKEFLSAHDILFDDVDVSANPEALKEMREISGGVRSVPVIVIDDTVLIGYDEPELRKVLKAKGIL